MSRLLLIAIALALAGCEKTTHENLDKWTHTEKGAGKIAKALADESIDPDLSAHAAENMMVKTGKDADVRTALEQMSSGRRTEVVAKLAPRLWGEARVEGDMSKPNATQVIAKDQLIAIRKYADDATKQQIDSYLVDWYCVGSFEQRSELGSNYGYTVMRLIGDRAAKKLMEVGNATIAAPGQDKVKNRIGDNLMIGLAATCTTDTVTYLLDIVKMANDRHDDTLPGRALDAIYKAYVDSGGLFDPCPPAALQPDIDRFVAIAKDEGLGANVAQDGVKLLRTIGPPACIAPLVGMVGHPHPNPHFKYVIAQQALRCGGVAAIKDVVRALPDVAYTKEELDGAIAAEIAPMSPRVQVLAALRELLDDKSHIARWAAVETLAAMKSTEDAPRLAAVKSSDKLVGFWGDQTGLPPKDRKEEPTLGARAKELAEQLGKGAK
ncbi:MAG TPA: hypothetical protein VMJ10_19310 [Kofleriaceae bacterium]|nr:hypothetical protein [Kofleriaceae bacterium]